MQRSLGVLIESSRFFVLACLALAALLAAACGGGGDKPPLTPDDVTANALDAGDSPPPDPNATQPAAPAPAN
jgi:hypothetical protein